MKEREFGNCWLSCTNGLMERLVQKIDSQRGEKGQFVTNIYLSLKSPLDCRV